MPLDPPKDAHRDSGHVVEGRVLEGTEARQSRPGPREVRVVDGWMSLVPKHTTRTMTLLALSPILILPFLLMATRLPAPVRPVLVVVAIALTAYTYVKTRKPTKRLFRVTTDALTVGGAGSDSFHSTYDAMSDLRIELTGEEANIAALVFTPIGPFSLGSGAARQADGSLRLPLAQGDVARLDAALRTTGVVGYRGILRA